MLRLAVARGERTQEAPHRPPGEKRTLGVRLPQSRSNLDQRKNARRRDLWERRGRELSNRAKPELGSRTIRRQGERREREGGCQRQRRSTARGREREEGERGRGVPYTDTDTQPRRKTSQKSEGVRKTNLEQRKTMGKKRNTDREIREPNQPSEPREQAFNRRR